MFTKRIIFLSILILGLLAACTLAADWLEISTPQEENLPPTISPTVSITITEEEPCAFMWASQSLPEISAELQKYLTERGMENIQVTAEAFGENCIRADGSVSRFLTMQTDVRLVIPAQNWTTPKLKAQNLIPIFEAILTYPRDLLPGPQRGYL